jgi:hypothetical protein
VVVSVGLGEFKDGVGLTPEPALTSAAALDEVVVDGATDGTEDAFKDAARGGDVTRCEQRLKGGVGRSQSLLVETEALAEL